MFRFPFWSPIRNDACTPPVIFPVKSQLSFQFRSGDPKPPPHTPVVSSPFPRFLFTSPPPTPTPPHHKNPPTTPPKTFWIRYNPNGITRLISFLPASETVIPSLHSPSPVKDKCSKTSRVQPSRFSPIGNSPLLFFLDSNSVRLTLP